MSRSYWRALGALIGLTGATVTIVYYLANNPASATGTAYKQQIATTNSAPYPNTALTYQQTLNNSTKKITSICASDRPNTKNQYDRDYLNAQKDMARNAGRMFYVGVVELILTSSGVLLVFCTLLAANRSAKAAEGVLKETTENSQRELRAYLIAEPIGIHQLIGNDRTEGKITVRNVGKIPARNVAVYTHMRLGVKDDITFLVPENVQSVDRVIQPGGVMVQGSNEELDLKDIIKWENFVFVFGVIYYDDGFGKTKFTKFCHRYGARTFDRSVDWQKVPTESRPFIKTENARYHTHGNDAS